MAIAITLVLAGCGLVPSPLSNRAATTDQPTDARHIEIEVGDLDSGLPCSVVDRPDASTRNVLWRAQFEQGFCHRKAEETRLILQQQGWACRPQSAEERRDLTQPSTGGPSLTPHVVAAWRCLGGLEPIARQSAPRPPVPAAKPDFQESQATSWGNEQLREAVERDLSAIGQDVIGDETTVQAASGDLNDDGHDDAVVVLTRDVDGSAPHRMLMAYLHDDEAYNLVDVWILKTPADREHGELTLAIENGTVRLEDCCEPPAGPLILVLDNRKLAPVKDG